MKLLVLRSFYKAGRRYVDLVFAVNGFERFRACSTFRQQDRLEGAAQTIGLSPLTLRTVIDGVDKYAEFEIVDGKAIELPNVI